MQSPSYQATAQETTQRKIGKFPLIEVMAMTHAPEDLRLLRELHLQALAEDEQKFLQPKEDNYFRTLLLCDQCKVIVIKVNGKLAGKVCIVLADSYADAQDNGHITYAKPDANLRQEFAKGQVAVIQSLCVLKAYRGHGLAKLLVEQAIRHACEHGVPHIFAQTKQLNSGALALFKSFGFKRRAVWGAITGRYLLHCRAPMPKRAKRQVVPQTNRYAAA